MILDLVLKNQILKDVTDSFQHLLRKTLSGCSNNPRALGIPMVKCDFVELNIRC